jgi:hypothetical protein
MLGQEGRRRTATTNNPRYVRQSSTRDESMDGTKYPLHRLSREQTERSENARINLREDERVQRLRENIRSLYPNSGVK